MTRNPALPIAAVTDPIKVALLTDDPLLRAGVSSLLAQLGSINVVEQSRAEVALWDAGVDAGNALARLAELRALPMPVVAIVPAPAHVAPAIAAGCTMVLKPSEFTPFSACVIAEVLDAAGVPPGVFNLVIGDGPTVGAAIAAHPDVDRVSFTGSGRAGAEVQRDAAATVKRVGLELGGKSANVVLDDADPAAPHGASP
jgi:acyl-CoA reductase-like NAD-dependent aldehyde dehydrogenase